MFGCHRLCLNNTLRYPCFMGAVGECGALAFPVLFLPQWTPGFSFPLRNGTGGFVRCPGGFERFPPFDESSTVAFAVDGMTFGVGNAIIRRTRFPTDRAHGHECLRSWLSNIAHMGFPTFRPSSWGSGNIGRPSRGVGTVERANEDDAIVKWDDNGRTRLHHRSLHKVYPAEKAVRSFEFSSVAIVARVFVWEVQM
jgi:hypothetical protein